jgi:hypothetical protein
MDNHANHSKTWSEAEIRMYLNGELSPRDRHELERAALDDPFLADALEGFISTAPPDSGLDDLRSRLAARLDKKEDQPVIAWFRRPFVRVAAVLIGLVGTGLIALFTLKTGKSKLEVDDAFAQTSKTSPAVAPLPPSTAAPAPPANSTAAPPQATAATADSITYRLDTAKTASPAAYASVEKKIPRQKTALAKSELNANRAIAGDNEMPAKKDMTLSSQPAEKPAAAAPALQYKDSRRVTQDTLNLYADRTDAAQQGFDKQPQITLGQQSLVVSGRVVDNNNRPLAGASLFLNNTPKTATTTDALGNFNISIHPRDTSQQMTVALIGYQQTMVSLNSNALTNNIIQLEQAKTGLNEVVVTGFGAKRKETFAAAPSDDRKERLDTAWQKVTPVTGRLAYQDYLDTAKRSLKLDTTISGIERISFQVDQKGQITEFKIEHSLSPAHDAGLIQLINAGPRWRILRGRKVRALVSLSFP